MKIYLKAYTQTNLGDDLFIKIISDRYSNHRMKLVSNNSTKLSQNIEIVSFNKFKLINKLIKTLTLNRSSYEHLTMKNSDLVIVIGGSMFIQNEKSLKSSHYLENLNNYYILGSNFGPYYTKDYYIRFYNIFKTAKDICFRDKYSYNLFKELPNVRCASDIVYSLDVSKLNITNRKRVIISVINCKKKLEEKYNDFYEDKIVELILYFYKRNYEICLMSFCKHEGDEDAIKSILNKLNSNDLKEKIETYNYYGNIDEALNVLADSQIIIGTRFHANILGLVLNKTVIPIAYSDKTINSLKDINFKGRIFDIRNLNDFDVNSISEDDLKYKLDIEFQKMDAQKHFEMLDKVLKRKEENE